MHKLSSIAYIRITPLTCSQSVHPACSTFVSGLNEAQNDDDAFRCMSQPNLTVSNMYAFVLPDDWVCMTRKSCININHNKKKKDENINNLSGRAKDKQISSVSIPVWRVIFVRTVTIYKYVYTGVALEVLNRFTQQQTNKPINYIIVILGFIYHF